MLTYVTVPGSAPAVQWLLVAKVRGIYGNRIVFVLTSWMMTYVTVFSIAPAVQWLLVAKVRGIYGNRKVFGLTCWMMTYVTVFIFVATVGLRWPVNFFQQFGQSAVGHILGYSAKESGSVGRLLAVPFAQIVLLASKESSLQPLLLPQL